MEITNSIVDHSPYAGFWKRFVAHLIDSIIILIPLMLILTGIRKNDVSFDENDRNVLAVIFGWLYYAILESSSAQATYGKRIMKIKVTGINGNRIKFGKASGRFFGKFISAIIVFFGFIMVAFTEKKQGLHDIISGCLVTNSKGSLSKKEVSPRINEPSTHMKTYYNKKRNLELPYPSDWEIIWENEPDGGWEIIVGIAGRQSSVGRPCVTLRALPHAVINFGPAHISVFAAGGSNVPSQLVRTAEEYNEECTQELKNVLPGVRFISAETGTLAGMPSATLVYTYAGNNGIIREKQVNLFGHAVTYRLLFEAPEEQNESIEKYFDTVVANFKPITDIS